MTNFAQPLKVALYCCLGVLIIISVVIWFWRSYPIELLSHFRVYYLLLAGVLAIAFSIYQIKGLNARVALYLSLALIAFNSVWIVPWYLPNSQQGSGKTIRVLTFNINVQNDRWDAIADAIRKVNPDIIPFCKSNKRVGKVVKNLSIP
jgi:hypothetical protein